ncbi:uncharacterized protein LOC117580370 isoform X2 [Drosophila guanche]|uniref:uncharacterized protein LOC117580370 isoform X2 n=1 Tax=Drosophila guanche TaxID=7266 RepID=UPI001471E1E6|nr:uncharacterized protein LOC117580370 isoform X2 [Drosophila guanche]
MEAPKKLQDMPFDILNRILKMLQLADQWNLANAHPRFCDAFVEHSRHRFTTFVIPLAELNMCPSEIVRLCGDTMIHIQIQEIAYVEHLLPLIERCCINLEKISIPTSAYNYKAVKSYLDRNPALIFVELLMNYNDHKWGISEAIAMFESIPNIKSLQLLNFPGHCLIKKKIKGFANLEELTVGESVPYDSVPKWRFDISDLLLRLKHLRRLKVSNRIVFLNRKLQEPLLEDLTLIYCDINFKKPFFPHLLSLRIKRSFPLSTRNQLLGFILKHTKTLKHLKVVTGHIIYAGDGNFHVRMNLNDRLCYRTIEFKQLKGLPAD